MPYVFFCLICVIWSSSFMLMKLATRCLTPIEVGAGRAIGGASVLALLFVITRGRLTYRKCDIGVLLAVVILGFAWPHSIQPWLVDEIGSGLVGMSVGLTPLFTLFFMIPMLGQWPTLRQGLGVVGALFFLIVLMRDSFDHTVTPFELGLAASVPMSYSAAICLIQRSLKHLPPLELTLLCLIANTGILLSLSAFFSRPKVDPLAPWVTAVLAVVVLGVVGTGLATFLFNRLVQEQGPLFATMTINVTPLGAVLWGWAMGEVITSTQVVALLGILTMITVVQFGTAHSSPASVDAEASSANH